MAIATVNPATGEWVKTFEPIAPAELEAKLALAQRTWQDYRHWPGERRSQPLLALAQLLEGEKAELAQLITLEMGKNISGAIAEIEKCAFVCRYYAEQGLAFWKDQSIPSDATTSYIRYEPLGVILAVMPWNFPFWQVFRFAAPALMAGNAILLKHASNVPQCALAIESLIHRAGFPTGAFQTLLLPGEQVAKLMADPRIKAATLTGSEPAGASLAQAAGQQLKPVVLELGGSDPFVVTGQADVAAAVATAVTARLLNNGQTCISAKRFIVTGDVYEAFATQLVQRYQALTIGSPWDPHTDIGPLATPQILLDLDHQVQTLVAAGAKVLIGGHPLPGPGNFYAPTILADIPNHPMNQEEFFGPVALLFRVADLDAAIALANATPFGLGASVWTQDATEQNRAIAEIEAGSVFVNGMVKSDPRLPFGGIKRSGFGRELGGPIGMQVFMNLKTVWIK